MVEGWVIEGLNELGIWGWNGKGENCWRGKIEGIVRYRVLELAEDIFEG